MRSKLFSLTAVLVLVITSSLMTGCITPQVRLAKAKQSFEEQNYRQAYHRLKPLAERGMPDAQYALGFQYYYGLGVMENKPLGIQWIEKAAAGGSQEAVRALTLMK